MKAFRRIFTNEKAAQESFDKELAQLERLGAAWDALTANLTESKTILEIVRAELVSSKEKVVRADTEKADFNKVVVEV